MNELILKEVRIIFIITCMSMPSSSESDNNASPTIERTSNPRKSPLETEFTVPFTIFSSATPLVRCKLWNYRAVVKNGIRDSIKLKKYTNHKLYHMVEYIKNEAYRYLRLKDLLKFSVIVGRFYPNPSLFPHFYDHLPVSLKQIYHHLSFYSLAFSPLVLSRV